MPIAELMSNVDQEKVPFKSNLQSDTFSHLNHGVPQPIQGVGDRFELPKVKASQMVGLSGSHSFGRTSFLPDSFREAQDNIEAFLSSGHRGGMHSSMSVEEPVILTYDPIVDILAAFYSIPDDSQNDLFSDFRDAAGSRDLRQLLDTISDWAATAELYANPGLSADLQEAIGGRKGVADWLPG